MSHVKWNFFINRLKKSSHFFFLNVRNWCRLGEHLFYETLSIKQQKEYVALELPENIPCEDGWAYTLARKISAQRIFEKKYKQSYRWFIEREQVNVPTEIIEEIIPYFTLKSKEFFPFKFLPYIECNLCIRLTFRPKVENG